MVTVPPPEQRWRVTRPPSWSEVQTLTPKQLHTASCEASEGQRLGTVGVRDARPGPGILSARGRRTTHRGAGGAPHTVGHQGQVNP